MKSSSISKDKRWYALKTKPRTEKKVARELSFKGIDYFLPMHKTLRQWSDRKKWIEKPLLSSYIFVYLEQNEFEHVRFVTGVSGFVKSEGMPAAIPEEQLNRLRFVVERDEKLEVTMEQFNEGDQVEVIQGHLCGLKGEMIEHRGKFKVVLKLDMIDQSVLVEVSKKQLRKANLAVSG